MSIVLDQVQLKEREKEIVKTEAARKYLKMLKLEKELKEEMIEVSKQLEREEIESISNYFNIPRYLTVREVANLTGASQQMVRRHCANGKYKGYQTSGPNGIWNIETEQFREHPDFMEFISSRNEKFIKTKNVAMLAKEMIDEELGGNEN